MGIDKGVVAARAPEMRFTLRCGACGERYDVTKSQLRWSDRVACAKGHVHELAEMLELLHEQGWNVHDLVRARGDFREIVTGLPLPHGGSFRAGEPGRRTDGPERVGRGMWRWKAVAQARPAEKGFKAGDLPGPAPQQGRTTRRWPPKITKLIA